jgi:glyoxylase-like metal-dependent hydrolase (beta-lactamase superfamily II)
LYFRQWLAGRDFGAADPIAGQMANFVYAVGDRETGECVLVDPCYAVDELCDLIAADVVGVVVGRESAGDVHAVGGDLFGHDLEGVAQLLTRCPCKVHAQREEAEWIRRQTGCSQSDLQLHQSGDVLTVGEIPITMIHTPGHTPGSQCFLVANRLIAGDTLFLQGCGRTDFPGGDPKQLYRSLTDKLMQVPDDTVLYPGHAYDPRPHALMGETRQSNPVFRPKTEAEWLAMFA